MTRRQVLFTGLGLALALTTKAWAIWGIGDITFDPTNNATNMLTAARSLVSNQQEARLILQNVESLANQAKDLAALPLSVLQDIEQAWQQYTQIMYQGQMTVGQIRNTVQQFEQLYASGWGGNGDMMQRAQALLGKVREAGRVANQAQSVYDRLTGQQRTVTRLMSASQAAPGSLAAQQATNQLLGTLANQQGNIQLLLATQHEVQTSWIMRQVVAEEQAQQNAQRWMADYVRAPVRGPGEGKGPQLPQ